MSKSREERVESALSSLIERLVPIYDDDDEESADQRLDEAYNYARDVLAG
jgi:hypothetical protein